MGWIRNLCKQIENVSKTVWLNVSTHFTRHGVKCGVCVCLVGSGCWPGLCVPLHWALGKNQNNLPVGVPACQETVVSLKLLSVWSLKNKRFLLPTDTVRTWHQDFISWTVCWKECGCRKMKSLHCELEKNPRLIGGSALSRSIKNNLVYLKHILFHFMNLEKCACRYEAQIHGSEQTYQIEHWHVKAIKPNSEPPQGYQHPDWETCWLWKREWRWLWSYQR